MSKTSHPASTKADLIGAIRLLLRHKTVSTQEEICTALEKQGLIINQAQASRILHQIGALKMNEGGKIAYRLPNEIAKVSPKDTLKQLIISITHNECLVVVQTAPGSSQLVARLLDLDNNHDVLGTVAGDDTIFVAPASTKKTHLVYQRISKMLLE